MDSPSTPQAPDPVATANAQGAANQVAASQTAALNRPNQVTPYGTLTWQDPGGPGATSTITLDPRIQAVVDSQLATSQGLDSSVQNALGRVNSTMAQPLDTSPEAFATQRQQAQDSVYDSYKRTLDPQFADQENQVRSDLINRGFMEGTAGYDREMQRLAMNRTDAYGQARRDSVSQGDAEQQRLMANQLTARNQIINELASLRTGQQTAQPQFSSGMSGANVAPAPIAQSTYQSYQGDLNSSNAQAGSNNSLMSGLFTLGGAAIGGPMGGMMGAGLSKMFAGQ